jgi:hypothetical protein
LSEKLDFGQYDQDREMGKREMGKREREDTGVKTSGITCWED